MRLQYRQLRTWVAKNSSRRLLRVSLRIALVLCILPVVLQVILAYMVSDDIRLLPAPLQRAKNLLIVTAHPDDECLFFSPSILAVLDKRRATVGGLVVLSTGVFVLCTFNPWGFVVTC
jgi:N-acetylglucosaminylphosphatidylinositol deacetylase